MRHSSYYLNPLEERFVLVRKIANLSNERIEITPFGASSFHATILAIKPQRLAPYRRLSEPLDFRYSRISSMTEAITFVRNLNFIEISS